MIKLMVCVKDVKSLIFPLVGSSSNNSITPMDPRKVHTMDDKSPVERHPAHISGMTANSVAPPPVTSFEPDIDGYVVSIRDIDAASVRSDRSVPSIIQIPCDDTITTTSLTETSSKGTISTSSEDATANSQQMSILSMPSVAAPVPPVPHVLQASFGCASPAAQTWAACDPAGSVTSTAPQLNYPNNASNEDALECRLQRLEQVIRSAAFQNPSLSSPSLSPATG